MSLFDAIIGIAERQWREKPRKDALRAFLALRRAMVECQSSYDRYRRKRTPLAKSKAHYQWQQSVLALGIVIAKVNPVLQMFDPTASQDVLFYHFDEKHPNDADYLALDFDNAAEAMNETSDIDLSDGALTVSFNAAITRLDAFIKANFKVEEVYAVQSKLSR